MSLHENTDFGRKIFFLNPPYDFKKNIIPVLSDAEYEVYVIGDYKYAKSILREFPDSICFVCIDDVMPADHWYNFIASFSNDPILSTIFIGVLATHPKAADRNHFLLNANIPAGFITISSVREELTETLFSILNLNGAKGHRKYVRADCREEKLSNAEAFIHDMHIYFSIYDISSVGIACGVHASMTNLFSQNMLVRDFTLNLREKKLKCNAIVLKIIPGQHETTIVFLFTRGIQTTVKSSIQEYIRLFLQTSIERIEVNSEPDETDYSKHQKPFSLFDLEDAFLIEDIEEVEDVVQ